MKSPVALAPIILLHAHLVACVASAPGDSAQNKRQQSPPSLDTQEALEAINTVDPRVQFIPSASPFGLDVSVDGTGYSPDDPALPNALTGTMGPEEAQQYVRRVQHHMEGLEPAAPERNPIAGHERIDTTDAGLVVLDSKVVAMHPGAHCRFLQTHEKPAQFIKPVAVLFETLGREDQSEKTGYLVVGAIAVTGPKKKLKEYRHKKYDPWNPYESNPLTAVFTATFEPDTFDLVPEYEKVSGLHESALVFPGIEEDKGLHKDIAHWSRTRWVDWWTHHVMDHELLNHDWYYDPNTVKSPHTHYRGLLSWWLNQAFPWMKDRERAHSINQAFTVVWTLTILVGGYPGLAAGLFTKGTVHLIAEVIRLTVDGILVFASNGLSVVRVILGGLKGLGKQVDEAKQATKEPKPSKTCPQVLETNEGGRAPTSDLQVSTGP